MHNKTTRLATADTKVDIFIPLYIGDYLKDTTFLTTEQHGAYLLMLFACWAHGAIPNSEKVICRTTGLSPESWQESKDVLLAYFKIKDGKIHHSRIDKELELAKARKDRFNALSKAGVEARKQNNTVNRTVYSKVHRGGNLVYNPSPSPSSSSLSPESTSECVQYAGAHADFVNKILNCRPEFSKLKPENLATEIHNAAGNPRWEKNLDEFLVDVVNLTEKPRNPLGMLRAYLNRAEKQSKNWETSL